MSEPIGVLRPKPLICGDSEYDPDRKHLPATYNSWHDVTACLCGMRWWDGRTSTVWKSDALHDHAGRGAQVIGWDTYEMRTI